MEGRDKTLAWVPHKSESETMVYGWGGGDIYLKAWAVEEELREELKQERKASLPSFLPACLPFHVDCHM